LEKSTQAAGKLTAIHYNALTAMQRLALTPDLPPA
jgi:hypothetical protein